MKKVRLTRKCHNHTLQTNRRYREEETQNTNSQIKLKSNYSKATSSHFPSAMIAKLETTLSNAQQSQDRTYPPPKKKEKNEQKAMMATINNESTVFERSAEATWGLN